MASDIYIIVRKNPYEQENVAVGEWQHLDFEAKPLVEKLQSEIIYLTWERNQYFIEHWCGTKIEVLHFNKQTKKWEQEHVST